MRIVYLHQYFATPSMSGGTRSYEMARRLAAFGHDVQVVTSDQRGRGSRWREERISGFDVHWVPIEYDNGMSYSRRMVAFADFAAKAAVKALRLSPDLVFASSTPLTVALPGVVASKGLRAPMVLEVRDAWPDVPIEIGALSHPLAIQAARQLERLAYAHSKRVVALSDGMASAVARIGYPRERISVIPNSCDLDLFPAPEEEIARHRLSLEWLRGRKLVLYAGTVGRANGVGFLAELARATREQGAEVCFAVLGAGAEVEITRRKAKALGVLNTNFFMLPPVPKREMPLWLGVADVAASLFVPLPSLEANSANKFFDALAAGKPVLVNYGGWQANVLREFGAGLQVPYDAVKAAATLVDHLERPGWIRDAAAAAYALGRERYSRDLLAKHLEDTLLQAMEG